MSNTGVLTQLTTYIGKIQGRGRDQFCERDHLSGAANRKAVGLSETGGVSRT